MLRIKIEGETESAETAMALLVQEFDILEAHKFEESGHIKLNLTLAPKSAEPSENPKPL